MYVPTERPVTMGRGSRFQQDTCIIRGYKGYNYIVKQKYSKIELFKSCTRYVHSLSMVKEIVVNPNSPENPPEKNTEG